MTHNRLSSYKTAIYNDGVYNVVIYHSTAIVRWDSDRIILNSSGWHTTTTKKKMNQASLQFNLGFYIYQKDYAWFVDFKDQTLEFEDNMILIRD